MPTDRTTQQLELQRQISREQRAELIELRKQVEAQREQIFVLRERLGRELAGRERAEQTLLELRADLERAEQGLAPQGAKLRVV